MSKNFHEIRDPIHAFINIDLYERLVLDSRPFQRLRNIHQLALTYLVYPGATHKRFEHSLGVMELAGRVYDVITNPDNLNDKIKKLLPQLSLEDERRYWRRVLRIAALCHDIGHLPFSHAAEQELLPDGWNHERITREHILSDEMKRIWNKMRPLPVPEDIVKLAIGPRKAPDMTFSDWETILSEIIVGDVFGVDRMDYLLRDSYHLGVAYGRFDHYRLIDTLRILSPPPSGKDKEPSTEPILGIEEGGIQSAESLLWARYFIYSQVYFHSVRRIYDIHLKDFLSEWLERGKFSIKLDNHLSLTDNEIISAIREISADSKKTGYAHAKRIIKRKHFKVLYQRNPRDIEVNPDASKAIYDAAVKKFGKDKVRLDRYGQKGEAVDFPVLAKDGSIFSSSSLISKVPIISIDYVFIDPDLHDKDFNWLQKRKYAIIKL